MGNSEFIKPYMDTWRWSKYEEKIVHDRCIGKVLHVCNGMSKLGHVTIDMFTKSDIKADALHLPLKNKCFDTVISDPLWNLSFNAKFWHELKRVAIKRIIVISLSAMKPGKGWAKPKFEVLANKSGFQLKVMTIYDRIAEDLTKYE